MSDANHTRNVEAVKVQVTGADLLFYMDALQRIADAVRPYEKVMFLGGPLPSSVAEQMHATFAAKPKDAPVLGAPLAKPENQR